MNPRLIVLLMTAVLLGASYFLLKQVNQARAERDGGTTEAHGSMDSSGSDSRDPESVDPKTGQDPSMTSDASSATHAARGSQSDSGAGSDSTSGKPAAASDADTGGGLTDEEPEVSYPGLGFNDPFFRDSESSLRMVVDLSDAKMSEPVAVVNGEPILYRDLISECTLRYGMDSVVGTVIREYVIVSELGRRAMPIVTDSQKVEAEIQRFLREKYRGKTLDQVLSDINFTESYFRFQVMLQRAMEDLYKMDEEDGELPNPFDAGSGGPTKARLEKWQTKVARRKALDEEIAKGGDLRAFNQKRRDELKSKGGPSHPLFMQIWMQQLITGHRIEQDPKVLPEEVFARVDGVEIDLKTVAPRLLLGLTDRQRYDALDKLIERRTLEQIFADRNIKADMRRVNRLYNEEKAEFRGSLITWEMYLQWESSNPTLYKHEMQIFDCIDQIQGLELSDETLKKHFTDHPAVFGHGGRRVSHILLSALDPKTGLPRGERAYEEAREKAVAVEEELGNGRDFFDLVLRFSEDSDTKKYSTIPNTKTRIAGDLGIVQARDTKVDPGLVAEVFAMEEGNTRGPILTRKGYHFLHVTEVRKPKEVPFGDVEVAVRRDFLKLRRQAFIEKAREKAKVEILFGGGENPWQPYLDAAAD